MADLRTDLMLERRGTGTTVSDRDGVELAERRGDLGLASGRENLAQALLNRLHTRRGALASLGHPAYGSRLHTLAGEPDTRRTRALAEFYVREALAADARVAEVASVDFETPPRNSPLRHTLSMRVVVLPADGGAPLAFIVGTG
jgi:phage gp46-like protein